MINATKCPIDDVYRNVFFIYVFGMGPITVVGTVFNILTIVIFQRQKRRGNSLFLLQVLAGGDLFFLLVCFLYFPFRHVYLYALYGDLPMRQDDWRLGGAVLRVVDPLFYVSVTIRNWLVVVVTVERLCNILMPLRARTMITKTRLVKIVAVLVFLAFGFQLERYIRSYLEPTVNECTGLPDVRMRDKWKTFRDFHDIYYVVFIILLPYTILFTSNIVLLVSLRLSMRSRAKMQGKQDQEDKVQRQASVMVASMIGVFTVCEVMSCVDRAMQLIGYKIEMRHETVNYMRKVSLLLTVLNSAVNFGAYVLTNRSFRKGFVGMFLPSKADHERSGHSDTGTTAAD